MSTDVQHAGLRRTIWQIASDLRGSVDGWDFKAYVLGFLFYRFISKSLTDFINESEAESGNTGLDYTLLPDADAEDEELRRGIVNEKGFFIRPSELFVSVRARTPHNENLSETLSMVFANIERSSCGTRAEKDTKGLFADVDVNSPELGNTVTQRNLKLMRILDAVGDMDLSYGESTIDAFDDTYEYLMMMCASSAGKSGGEFFTPQEVSEVLARVTIDGREHVGRVYGPACGSGSLLLKFTKILGIDNVEGFFGQEVNLMTYNLCWINMFLHDINFADFGIAPGDTLLEPAHQGDEPFDVIVSNPPYSMKWVGKDDPTLLHDPRFAPAGVPAPKLKADLTFAIYTLNWLKVDGTAVIVEFPGVLYRETAEQKIRQYLVDNNYVGAMIRLPPDLLFGMTITTCTIVSKKSKKDGVVFFLDASDQFERKGNKNVLTEANRDFIIGSLVARTDIDYKGALIDAETIARNSYNLSVSPYVEPENACEEINTAELNERIAVIVERQAELRAKIDATVADLEGGAR